jgi:hypothetical protein
MDEPNTEPKQPNERSKNDGTPLPAVSIQGDGIRVNGDIVGHDKIIYIGDTTPPVSARDREARELLEEAETLVSASQKVCSVVLLEQFRLDEQEFFKPALSLHQRLGFWPTRPKLPSS